MSWLCDRRRSALPALLVAAAALLSPGCGRVVENRAEQAINQLLPRYLGPADRWSSRVSGGTGAMLRGRLQRVHVEGDNVRLAPGLTVEKLTLELSDVSVDRKAGRLEGVGSTTFTARLGEAALNRYLRQQRPNLRDLSVTAGADGRLTLRTRPELFGYPTLPVEVRGTLQPAGGGSKLDFVPDRARLSIVPIPVFVAEHIADRLNPAVDLAGVPVPIVVHSARVEAGGLSLSGSVPSDALLKAAREAVERAP